MRTLAQDTVNDITLIETIHGDYRRFHIRYGLDIKERATLGAALEVYQGCLVHAMGAEHHLFLNEEVAA